MKRLFLCLAVAAMGATTSAQDSERVFKRFKVDLSLGFAMPVGSAPSGGILFALEPKYAVMDQLALGIRIEGAVMDKVINDYNGGNTELESGMAAASFLATADYYFNNNYSFRPFIGGGMGVFATSEDVTYYVGETEAITFGGMIRAGGEVNHFRFAVEFNLIPSTGAQFYDYNTGTQVHRDIKNCYIGIKAGFCFGGGPITR